MVLSIRRAPQDTNAKTAIAAPKLIQVHRASFQSRAASMINTVAAPKPHKTVHKVDTPTSSNSFRMSRIGETFTKLKIEGPAKPNSKHQATSTLHRTGHSETGGNSVNTKLPKSIVNTYWPR